MLLLKILPVTKSGLPLINSVDSLQLVNQLDKLLLTLLVSFLSVKILMILLNKEKVLVFTLPSIVKLLLMLTLVVLTI
jgi:hypothetical protein